MRTSREPEQYQLIKMNKAKKQKAKKAKKAKNKTVSTQNLTLRLMILYVDCLSGEEIGYLQHTLTNLLIQLYT